MLAKLGLAGQRDADWLTPDRALSYLRVYLITQVVLYAFIVWTFWHYSATTAGGRPVATDFIAFWAAAHLAVAGHAAQVYDDGAVAAFEHAHAYLGDQATHFPFLYPPPYLLLLLPLGLMAYLPAIVVFLTTGYALLASCLRRIVTPVWAWLPLILSPAMLLNTMINQNGAYTASCFAGAMLFLDRLPVIGGVCLGLLVCKPHLAVAVPVALLASRRWQALLACAATAVAMCAASWLAFGTDTWVQFLSHARDMTPVLNNEPTLWPKMQTPYGAVRMLHGSARLGYALQAITALVSLAYLARMASLRPQAAPLVATMVAATLLCSPYVLNYDLVCLLVPMAFLAADALRTGWRPYEKLLLLALFPLPIVAGMVTSPHGIPLVPPLIACLLVLCARRGQKVRVLLF